MMLRVFGFCLYFQFSTAGSLWEQAQAAEALKSKEKNFQEANSLATESQNAAEADQLVNDSQNAADADKLVSVIAVLTYVCPFLIYVYLKLMFLSSSSCIYLISS